MKRLKSLKIMKLLSFVLLMPVMLAMGTIPGTGGPFYSPDDGGGEGGDSGQKDSGKSDDGADDAGKKSDKGEDGKTDDKGDKDDKDAKKFTQADLDRIVKDRLARQKKKDADAAKAEGDKAAKADAAAKEGKTDGTDGDSTNNEAVDEANAMVEKAKATLIMSTAQTEAIKLGVDPKYVADVVRLADVSDIAVDDNTMAVDDKAVSKAIDDVLKRVPVFKAAAGDDEKSAGFKSVGGKKVDNPYADGKQSEGSAKSWNRRNRR